MCILFSLLYSLLFPWGASGCICTVWSVKSDSVWSHIDSVGWYNINHYYFVSPLVEKNISHTKSTELTTSSKQCQISSPPKLNQKELICQSWQEKHLPLQLQSEMLATSGWQQLGWQKLVVAATRLHKLPTDWHFVRKG